MYQLALFLHILGWAQWMTGQIALTGLLRRPFYFTPEAANAKPTLKGLWVNTLIGVVMAVGAALWLVTMQPSLMRQGWLHSKILLAAVEIVIWLGPLRQAYNGVGTERPALSGAWFGVTLAGFIALIALAVFRPF